MENATDLFDNYSKEDLLKLLKSQIKVNSELESKANELESFNSKLEFKTKKLESKTNKLEFKSVKLEILATKLEQENSYLKFQIEQFKRAMYGSKKERFIASENPEQLAIPFEIDQQEVAQAVESVKEQITYEREKTSKKHQGRMALPSHLEVKEIILEPTQNVEGMKCIGQEITDELEYAPAKLFINRYIRNKYISEADDKGNQQVKIADLDFRPIPKCIAGTHLLTQIIIDKFVDHLPLYRQIQRFSREGVDIPSSTIDSWVGLISQLLRPLYESHRQHTVKNGYLQADESPIKVQDKDKKGATHTGYMWVYHAPIPQSVYFDYRKGRGSEGPLEMLNGFEGYLQTDGYGVYPQFALKENVTQVACWAHARRYFEKALDYNKTNASHVMLLIQKLYEIERKATSENLSAQEKHALRLEESHPVLNEIGNYISVQSKLELPKSPLAKAYDYCLKRWDSLMAYLKDGNLHIDNNLVENAIRPLAIGRKNYLFAGSHEAAKNIAMYYSFFATCKKNNVNPSKWLHHVIENINDTKTSELHNLLPQYINQNLVN